MSLMLKFGGEARASVSTDIVAASISTGVNTFHVSAVFEPGEARAFAALLVDAANQADRERDMQKAKDMTATLSGSPRTSTRTIANPPVPAKARVPVPAPTVTSPPQVKPANLTGWIDPAVAAQTFGGPAPAATAKAWSPPSRYSPVGHPVYDKNHPDIDYGAKTGYGKARHRNGNPLTWSASLCGFVDESVIVVKGTKPPLGPVEAMVKEMDAATRPQF